MQNPERNPNSLGQDLEIALIRVIAPFVRRKVFVDVGAEKGSFASAMFPLGLKGILIEPMARHREALSKLAAGYDGVVLTFAINERDGARELYVATDAGGRELDYYHSLQKLESESRFHHSRSIPVTCRSIASLVEEGVIPRDVGILKTDTEGNDLAVLKGLGATRPECVVCEYFTEGLYAGWENARPELAIELMRTMGYSRWIATKRVDEFEYCASAPAGFLPRQWGNLFFLSEALYGDAERDICLLLTLAESRMMEGIQAISADRVAKECVIQGLLAR